MSIWCIVIIRINVGLKHIFKILKHTIYVVSNVLFCIWTSIPCQDQDVQTTLFKVEIRLYKHRKSDGNPTSVSDVNKLSFSTEIQRLSNVRFSHGFNVDSTPFSRWEAVVNIEYSYDIHMQNKDDDSSILHLIGIR